MGILVAQGVFSFVRVYTFSIVSERTLADIRSTVYEKIIWLPMTFFDRSRVGELLSRITSDVSTLQDTFTITWPNCCDRYWCYHWRHHHFRAYAQVGLIHDSYFSVVGNRAILWKIHPKLSRRHRISWLAPT